MLTGAITQQIDVAQMALIIFFIFFLGLVFYLRREDKLEGYPLDEPGPQMHHGRIIGFPEPPPPKILHLLDGGTSKMPHYYEQPPMDARYTEGFGGAPLAPLGNPLLSGVGPATWVMRKNEPFLLADGQLQVIPIRGDLKWGVRDGEVDPRGMPVFSGKRYQVGTVVDLWVDRSVKILRYLEVQLNGGIHSDRRVLLPIYYADIRLRAREILVDSLQPAQFAEVPALSQPDVITAREEDRVNAYYAGGLFETLNSSEMVRR